MAIKPLLLGRAKLLARKMDVKVTDSRICYPTASLVDMQHHVNLVKRQKRQYIYFFKLFQCFLLFWKYHSPFFCLFQ